MMDSSHILFSQDKSFNLEKLDDRNIKESPGEIRAFIVARNELAGLPFLFSYYRNLGVDRFFLINDHSNDGTREYALAQPDTHVFAPSNSFGEANHGIDWQNLLLDTFGTGHWTLVVDADELLIYPHCEKMKLPEFCRFLDREGSTALFVFMLDMYPDKNLSDAICESGKPFYETCAFFDSQYVFRSGCSEIKNGFETFPAERVLGGPRLRKFYPWQRRTAWFSRLALKLIIKFSEKAAFWADDQPHYAPALIKVPLIKWQKEDQRLTSHIVAKTQRGKVAKATGVLLHFKFFAAFHNKAKEAIASGQHYKGGLEYRRYLSCICKNPDISFMYEGSRRYVNSDSVLKEGLMRTTDSLDEEARNLK